MGKRVERLARQIQSLPERERAELRRRLGWDTAPFFAGAPRPAPLLDAIGVATTAERGKASST